MTPGRSLRILLLIVAIVLLVVVGRVLPVVSWLEGFIDWISTLGFAGAVLYIGGYVLASVLFVPGLILTLGAGVVYGPVWGTVVASLGGTLGAGAAFLVGRYFAREQVARWVAANPRSAAIDAAVRREGGKIVLLMRLSPVFPFNLLNYMFGLTGVGFWRYLLASWAGMLPATFLYVQLGFAGRVAAGAATTDEGVQMSTALIWGAGLVATALLTWYLTRLASRALKAASG